jgi:hypothetical protein
VIIAFFVTTPGIANPLVLVSFGVALRPALLKDYNQQPRASNENQKKILSRS